MNVSTPVNCLIILFGATIMLLSIVQAGSLTKALDYVPERHRKQLGLFLLGHRMLMIFFLLGYIIVAAAFAFRSTSIGETFVSIIFLFGAVFVFIGIIVQSRLLSEIQQTLQGILPICAKCKKIRITDDAPMNPKAWKTLEAYISEKASVRFSHGYCPDCYAWEMKCLDDAQGKA